MQFQRNVQQIFLQCCVSQCALHCAVECITPWIGNACSCGHLCAYIETICSREYAKNTPYPIMTQSHNWIQKMSEFYQILNFEITTQRDWLGNTGNQRKLEIAQSYDGYSSKILLRIWRIRIFLSSINWIELNWFNSLFHKMAGITNDHQYLLRMSCFITKW